MGVLILEERYLYAECQECQERAKGATKKEVHGVLKKYKWLTKEWEPPGWDVVVDTLCPACVESYKEER